MESNPDSPVFLLREALDLFEVNQNHAVDSLVSLLIEKNHSYSEAQRLDVLQALTPVLVVAASVHQLSTRSHPVPHPLDATVFKCFVLTAQLLTRCRGDTTGRYREHWHAIVKLAGQLIDRTHPMCTSPRKYSEDQCDTLRFMAHLVLASYLFHLRPPMRSSNVSLARFIKLNHQPDVCARINMLASSLTHTLHANEMLSGPNWFRISIQCVIVALCLASFGLLKPNADSWLLLPVLGCAVAVVVFNAFMTEQDYSAAPMFSPALFYTRDSLKELAHDTHSLSPAAATLAVPQHNDAVFKMESSFSTGVISDVHAEALVSVGNHVPSAIMIASNPAKMQSSSTLTSLKTGLTVDKVSTVQVSVPQAPKPPKSKAQSSNSVDGSAKAGAAVHVSAVGTGEMIDACLPSELPNTEQFVTVDTRSQKKIIAATTTARSKKATAIVESEQHNSCVQVIVPGLAVAAVVDLAVVGPAVVVPAVVLPLVVSLPVPSSGASINAPVVVAAVHIASMADPIQHIKSQKNKPKVTEPESFDSLMKTFDFRPELGTVSNSQSLPVASVVASAPVQKRVAIPSVAAMLADKTAQHAPAPLVVIGSASLSSSALKPQPHPSGKSTVPIAVPSTSVMSDSNVSAGVQSFVSMSPQPKGRTFGQRSGNNIALYQTAAAGSISSSSYITSAETASVSVPTAMIEPAIVSPTSAEVIRAMLPAPIAKPVRSWKKPAAAVHLEDNVASVADLDGAEFPVLNVHA